MVVCLRKIGHEMQEYKKCWGCDTNFVGQDDIDLYQYQFSGLARYGVASLECTAVLCRVLDKEREWAGYPPIHRLLIDVYAVCHPPYFEIQQKLEIESRLVEASIQSVAVHLIALYLAFEKKIPLREISKYMRKILDSGIKLEELQLVPPLDFGPMSILDIDQAVNFEEYEKLVEQWAFYVWQLWSEYHAIIAKICLKHVS